MSTHTSRMIFGNGSPNNLNGKVRFSNHLLKDIFGEIGISSSNRFEDNEYFIEASKRSVENISLLNIEWKGCFRFDKRLPDNVYVFYLASEGGLTIRIDSKASLSSSVNESFVANPGQHLAGETSSSGKILVACIDKEAIHKELATLLRSNPEETPFFESTIDLKKRFGSRLKELGRFLWELADVQEEKTDLVQCEITKAFIVSLLKGLSHSYSEPLQKKRGDGLKRHVRKAKRHIRTNLEEDLQLDDIAEAVGVCPRILQKAFAYYCDCSPMQYYKQERLKKVYEELSRGDRTTKVTDVMLRYGFTQGGKFAKAYRKLFGELPSDTLKKSIFEGCSHIEIHIVS